MSGEDAFIESKMCMDSFALDTRLLVSNHVSAIVLAIEKVGTLNR